MSTPAPIVLWQRLTSMAVLGTARAAMPELPMELSEHLSQALASAQVADPDRCVLRLAAVLSPCGRAGSGAPTMTEPVHDVAPRETLAPCSARSASHLEAILFGAYPDLLDEW